MKVSFASLEEGEELHPISVYADSQKLWGLNSWSPFPISPSRFVWNGVTLSSHAALVRSLEASLMSFSSTSPLVQSLSPADLPAQHSKQRHFFLFPPSTLTAIISVLTHRTKSPNELHAFLWHPCCDCIQWPELRYDHLITRLLCSTTSVVSCCT